MSTGGAKEMITAAHDRTDGARYSTVRCLVKRLDLDNALGETVKNFNCALEICVHRYVSRHWFF
jgi:hypothetical protein